MQAIFRGGNRILISTSTNVYKNLAFERYLAENVQHQSKTRLLLLWRNEPCVVIGRYQNPFIECDVKYINENRIHLARRYSGGGTCYHDLGNLNMTIFTTREDYNRAKNLQWIVESLNEKFHLSLHRTERDDIFLDNYKVTGSASRLERLYAYHHFTLLINANLNDLRRSLKSIDIENITSKATPSVRSSVFNLSDRNISITQDQVVQTLTKTFFQWNTPSEFTPIDYIDPSNLEKHFQSIENDLKSDNFLYHSTPPFVYTIKTSGQTIDIHVSNGIITEIKQNESILNSTDLIGQYFHQIYENLQTLKSKVN